MTSQATNQRVITEERVATPRATQLGKNHPRSACRCGQGSKSIDAERSYAGSRQWRRHH